MQSFVCNSGHFHSGEHCSLFFVLQENKSSRLTPKLLLFSRARETDRRLTEVRSFIILLLPIIMEFLILIGLTYEDAISIKLNIDSVIKIKSSCVAFKMEDRFKQWPRRNIAPVFAENIRYIRFRVDVLEVDKST